MEPRRISHYELKRLIGKGGMGEVYEAEDLDLGRRRVALKFVSPELAADPESLKRFEREAVSAARLKHPNIAVVHAFVPDPAAPFIDMELIEGGSLRAMLNRGALSLDQSLAIARDVASALAHAHARGIIHRDIKPENLMFDADGTLKVMDFGLARAVEGSRLTQDGSSLGTPSYMAPEAIRGEPTAASDLFALGVMMHEMLAGRPPFGGDKPLAVLYNIMNERPRPLREARPDTPPAVASLVDRLLEKEAALRPDAATLARELAALTGAPPPRPEATTEELETRRLATGQALPSAAQLSSVRTRATTVALGADEAPTQAMEVPALPVPATAAPPAPPQRRRRAGVVFFGLLALALAAAAALVWFAMGRAGLERDRQEALALNNRGTERLRAGEVDSAVVLFEAALRRQPGFGPALVNLGVARHRRGETDAAVALLTQVLERHGRDSTLAAQAEFELGSIELDSGNPPVAVPHFERAVALEPGNPGYANNLAFALIQVGRPREAEDRIDRLLETYPNDPYLLKNKALALIELEREVEALPLLERAMRADATLPSPWGWRAVARAMGGDRAGATADWAAYLERGPSVDERTEIARRLTGLGVAPAAP